jgi:hypothetical protein
MILRDNNKYDFLPASHPATTQETPLGKQLKFLYHVVEFYVKMSLTAEKAKLKKKSL